MARFAAWALHLPAVVVVRYQVKVLDAKHAVQVGLNTVESCNAHTGLTWRGYFVEEHTMNRTVLSIGLALGLAFAALGCNTTPVQDGAVLGGALGAASGAIIGHQSGHQGEGALIGAGLGALTGAIVGDQVQRERQQRPIVREQGMAPAPQQYRRETRIVESPNGEKYEQEVLVPY